MFVFYFTVKIHKQLNLPSLSNDRFIQVHLMPYLQSTRSHTRNCLTLFILDNLRLFCSDYLKNTEVISDSSISSYELGIIKLYPASRLIDPRDHINIITIYPLSCATEYANTLFEIETTSR